MFKFSSKVGPNIKVLAVPVAIISVIIILSVLFAQKGVPAVNSKIKEFKVNREEEAVLSRKLDSLKSIPLEALDSEDISVVALPSKNPGVWIVSQARRSSREMDVAITKISLTNFNKTEEMTSFDISLEIETENFDSLLEFVKDFTVFLPILSLRKVEAERTENEELLTGEIEASFFWSDFPENLPPLTQAVEVLSEEDVDLLQQISNFKLPVFNELTPTDPRERLDPFN